MTATPSQALRALAMGPSPEDRHAAAIALLSRDRDIPLEAAPVLERLASVLEGAWHEIHSSRPDLVAGLVEAVRTDPGLLTIEVAASALALEGEDGVTELLTLGTHGE